MINIRENRKYLKFAVYAVNSLLIGLTYILFHKNFIAENGFAENLFTLFRTIIFICLSLCSFFLFALCGTGNDRKKYELFVDKVATHPLLTTVLVSVAFRIWYLSHFSKYVLYYDTKTYTNFPYNIFLGETDIFRTPGYPYFLKIIHYITGNPQNNIEFYESVSVVQSILSLISIIILYMAGRKLFSNKYILSFACLVYGVAPGVFNWDIITLTETLSLFCTVVLIYIVFSYLAKPSGVKAIILGLYAFVMIMIRPTFVYLLAVLGVFFVARFVFNCKERKKALAGILSVAMSVALFFGYCGLNYKNYDYFKVSSVSNDVNNLYIVLAYSWYENEDYPEITEHLQTQLDFFGYETLITDIVEPLPEYFSYRQIDEYVTDCISKHKSEYNEYTKDKFLSVLSEKITAHYIPLSQDENATRFEKGAKLFTVLSMPFTVYTCLFFVLFGILFSLLAMIKKKRICWQVLGLCAIIFSHIFVSVYGSMGEFSRLFLMAVPAMLLLVFYIIDYAYKATGKQKFFCLNNNNSNLIEFSNKKSIKKDNNFDGE